MNVMLWISSAHAPHCMLPVSVTPAYFNFVFNFSLFYFILLFQFLRSYLLGYLLSKHTCVESICCFVCGRIASFNLLLDRRSATPNCLLQGLSDRADAGWLGYGDGGYPC